MGNLSRKAALGVAVVLTAATAATLTAEVAGAAPVTASAPTSSAMPAALAGLAAPMAAAATVAPNWWTESTPWGPLIGPGYYGDRVAVIECLLKQRGFWLGNCTPQYTPTTRWAITQFQKSAWLVPDGIVGPATWSGLIITAPSPAASPWGVLAAQSSLCFGNGTCFGGVDGIYGPKTSQAVMVFQSNHSLAVDGIVGPDTWQSLIRNSSS
jgi:peptidoglycan hydrolase-like protein with peptidoglycan-binding domain